MKGLIYRGSAVSMTFPLYSGVNITLKPEEVYEFKPTDLLTSVAMEYYESLKTCDVFIVEDEKEEMEVVTKKAEASKVEEPKNEEPKVEVVKDVIEEVKEEKQEEITDNELIEFLDVNYDESGIKNLSRQVGNKPNGKKITVIKKIISTNRDFVIQLMKN